MFSNLAPVFLRNLECRLVSCSTFTTGYTYLFIIKIIHDNDNNNDDNSKIIIKTVENMKKEHS